MSGKSIISNSYLEDIGDAIRQKKGTEDTYYPSQMGSAIRSIENVTVDDSLSDTSENPVQNKVITQALQSKCDTETVSALSDAVTALDDDVTALQTGKADKSYVDSELSTKASTQTVSDLSDDVSDLQTGLAGKVSDVQINGSSVVTNGVANVPKATSYTYGVVMFNGDYGIVGDASWSTPRINTANTSGIKNGVTQYRPITPSNQHESAFYGLAKVAGHDEKSSTLPVGTYSEEAKIAIQKMLGIYEAPWELIREDTFTNAEEADHIITTDANGDAFELTDAILLFETPKQETEAKFAGIVRNYFYDVRNWIANETYSYTQSSNSASTGIVSAFEQRQKMLNVWSITRAEASNFGSYSSRYGANFGLPLGSGDRVSFALLDEPIYCYKISILKVTGTGHYRLYGKRKWTWKETSWTYQHSATHTSTGSCG